MIKLIRMTPFVNDFFEEKRKKKASLTSLKSPSEEQSAFPRSLSFENGNFDEDTRLQRNTMTLPQYDDVVYDVDFNEKSHDSGINYSYGNSEVFTSTAVVSSNNGTVLEAYEEEEERTFSVTNSGDCFLEQKPRAAKQEKKLNQVDVTGFEEAQQDRLQHLQPASDICVPRPQTMEQMEDPLAVDRGRVLSGGGDYSPVVAVGEKLVGATLEDSGHFGTETEESDQQISPYSQASSHSGEMKLESRVDRGIRNRVEMDPPPPIRSEPPTPAHPSFRQSSTTLTSGKTSAYDKLKPFLEPGLDKLQRNPNTAGLEYLTRYQEEAEVVDSGVELNRESASPSRDSRESLSPRSPLSAENGHYGQREMNGEKIPIKSPVMTSVVAKPRYKLRDDYEDKEPIKWRYQQKESNKRLDDFTIILESNPMQDRGFGFTIKGGKDKKEPIKIDGVILGSAADKARILVGDEVLFVNGEDVSNKFLAKVNMMIRESHRLGEIELLLRRTHYGGSPTFAEKSPVRRSPSPRAKATFDEKRSVFTHQPQIYEDSFLRFKKNRRHSDYTKSGGQPTTKGASVASSRPYKSVDEEPVNSARNIMQTSPVLNRKKQPGRIENFVPEVERSGGAGDELQRGSGTAGFDYRVSSLQRNRSPGRILDFVPEIERKASESSFAEPETPVGSENEPDVHWRKEKEYVMSKSGESGYLRPSSRSSTSSSSAGRSKQVTSPSPVRNYSIDGPINSGRLMVNTHSRDNSGAESGVSSHLSPASSHLTSSSGAEKQTDDLHDYNKQEEESPEEVILQGESGGAPDLKAEEFVEAKLQRMEQTKKLRTVQKRARASFLGLPNRQPSQESETEIDKFDCNNYLRWDSEREFFQKALELLKSPPAEIGVDSEPETSWARKDEEYLLMTSSQLLYPYKSSQYQYPHHTSSQLVISSTSAYGKRGGAAQRIARSYAKAPNTYNGFNSGVGLEPQGPIMRQSSEGNVVHLYKKQQARQLEKWREKHGLGPVLIRPIPTTKKSILVLPVRNPPPLKRPTAHSSGLPPVESASEVRPTASTHFTPIEAQQGKQQPQPMVEEQPPRPFSHVKKDIVFSSEPVPGGDRRPTTAYYPPLSQQLKPGKGFDSDAPAPPYQAPLLRAVSPVPGQEPAGRSYPIDSDQMYRRGPEPPVVPAPGKETLEQRQATELQYMNLAARVEQEKSERGHHQVDRQGTGNQPHLMPRMSVDTQGINHWLVKEAENRRLSDQAKQQRSPRQHSAPNRNSQQYAATNGHYENLPIQHSPQGRSPVPKYGAGPPPPPPSIPPPPPPTAEQPSPSEQDQVVSVSGKQKCSHCSEELGRGAAMIIESLNLFYHLGCFRCYVCSVALGNGAQGADVRIRAGKLHCQSCYSNDEVGLKFSEV